jgi:signal transduction histidine kinase
MSAREIQSKLSFQAKILLPVITLLVLLPAVTLAIIHRKSMQNLARNSRQQLRTFDAVFQNSLNLRARQLVARYKNLANDPRFRAVATLRDAATMNQHLHDRLDDFGDDADIVLYVNEQGVTIASAQRDASLRPIQFDKAANTSIRQALAGQPNSLTIPVNTAVLSSVAVPVVVDDKVIGVLVAGVRIDFSTLKELTSVTGVDGVVIANSNVSASTLLKSDLHAATLPHWTSTPEIGGNTAEPVVVDGLHYLALASRFKSSNPQDDLGYVLLFPYENELQELRQTEATLWMLCLIGICTSTIVIWLVISRITHPLRDLRSNAEAVGNGDFTRKVQVQSSDELGQLGQAFNTMTRNLRTSHAELQKTVQTLKATQAQLIQSEKLSAVGEFVAGIAHELNNPLTSVIGFGELLKEASLGPKHQSYLQYIVRSTERCHKIVQGLLSFARQHPPERRLLSVNELVEAVLEILAYELRTGNIEVHRAFQPELPKIMGDSHQLQQVILNLLNNARQAIEAHQHSGHLYVTTESSAAAIRITVEDNGPGISQENLSRIFDPFFTTKPVGKGTGLGLSLCYGIIREHGGTITAFSTPGKGATFTIELPIAEKETSKNDGGSNGASVLDGTGKRALVIDDEEWILELVRQILKQDGFEVDVAPDGQAALKQVAGGNYELLVCDWKMPGLSGPQLYSRISDINPGAASRVIFMTGDVVNDSFQQFLKENDKSCLSKPFSVHEFRSTIGGFIAARN